MSLFSTMNTAVSGMSAQSTKLSTIGDNISNQSTTGYKAKSVDFESVLGGTGSTSTSYNSGGVTSTVTYGISTQGTLETTTSSTDLAISGNGFFLVSDSDGNPYLTRAGSFTRSSSGDLVNSAGYTLMGYSLTDGSTATANGTEGLTAINLSSQGLSASASTSGSLSVNLPSTATAISGDTPSSNNADSTYTEKTSLVAYDNLGNAITLDVYMTKTDGNTWEVTAYNHADANTDTGVSSTSFPYSSSSLGSTTVNYDPTTGAVASGGTLDVNLGDLGGYSDVAISLATSTQLAAAYTLTSASVNGTAPSELSSFKISADGTVTSVYANGDEVATYRIPLASVESPDNLTSLNGNVYQTSVTSGAMTIGTAASGNLGSIEQSQLEDSTVDLATELTSMITAQRAYEANSKVLSTSSDLLKMLTNLQT